MTTMEIFYKCVCMKEETKCTVPLRQEGEDIGKWMHKVGIAISADHQIRIPICNATAMEYAKIPLPENAPFIGAKGKLNS